MSSQIIGDLCPYLPKPGMFLETKDVGRVMNKRHKNVIIVNLNEGNY